MSGGCVLSNRDLEHAPMVGAERKEERGRAPHARLLKFKTSARRNILKGTYICTPSCVEHWQCTIVELDITT